MNSKKIKKAFTLIELLVSITLISIMILSVSSLDYNRLSVKQELAIFTNSVKSNFETIRNSSLSWKWVWNDLILPEKWKVEYSGYNSWTIVNSTYDWVDRTPLNITPLFKYGFSISKIRCLTLDWNLNTDITSTWTWIIEFDWGEMTLVWDCDIATPNTSKILELTIKNRSDTKTLLINTLNWLSEIK